MSWIKRHKKLALFLALALIFLGWWWQRSQFTPERWAARPGERHHIVDDLLTQYGGLKGMSQEEVVSLLGPDTDGDQREERLTPGGPEARELFVYPIGSYGLGWGYLFLYLEDGTVTESRIYVD